MKRLIFIAFLLIPAMAHAQASVSGAVPMNTSTTGTALTTTILNAGTDSGSNGATWNSVTGTALTVGAPQSACASLRSFQVVGGGTYPTGTNFHSIAVNTAIAGPSQYADLYAGTTSKFSWLQCIVIPSGTTTNVLDINLTATQCCGESVWLQYDNPNTNCSGVAATDLETNVGTPSAQPGSCITVTPGSAYLVAETINNNAGASLVAPCTGSTGCATYYIWTATNPPVYVGGANVIFQSSGNVVGHFFDGNMEIGTVTGSMEFENIVYDTTGQTPIPPSCTTTASAPAETAIQALLASLGAGCPTTVANIPAGSATWTTQTSYTPPAAITTFGLLGACTPNTGIATFGAGTCTTTITDNGGNSNPILSVNATYPQVVEVGQFNLLPQASTNLMAPIFFSGTCTASGCPQVRLTNVTFGTTGNLWTEGSAGSNAAQLTRVNNFFGVYDHNTTPLNSDVGYSNVSLSSYLGVGSYGDNSWAQADSYGTANNLFYENNLCSNAGNPGQFADNEAGVGSGTSLGGTRVVMRYNHCTQTGVGTNSGLFNCHGNDSGGRARSCREFEIYGNQVTCLSIACANALVGLRGGSGVSVNNTVNASGTSYASFISPDVYRRFAGFAPWAGCTGNSPWDVDDGVTYYTGTVGSGTPTTSTDSGSPGWTTNQWGGTSSGPYSFYDVTLGIGSEIVSNTAGVLTFESGSPYQSNQPNPGDSYKILRASICMDQPARGAGLLVQNATPVLQSTGNPGSVADVLDPVYEAGDVLTAGGLNHGYIYTAVPAGFNLFFDHDLYQQDGAIQTTPTSPFNGTTGTGYGTLANRPSTCSLAVGYYATNVGSQGTLYVCSSGSWVVKDSFYVYPHPLAGTAAPPPPPAPAAVMLAVKAN